MARQRPWDKYEAVILLEAVIKVRSGALDRNQAIIEVSEKLRRKARMEGTEIDDVYRNVAGITFQMQSMESAYVGHTLIKPATKLFSTVVKLRNECRDEYGSLFHEALKLIGEKTVDEQKHAEETGNTASANEEKRKFNYDEKIQLLNRRLKSMAAVYDDANGFKTEWIQETLGLPICLSELEETMDNISWITKVNDGRYSFSKHAIPMIDFDEELFKKVLMLRYPNGMQFDSIDLDNYREKYCDVTGKELKLTDEELISCLRKCGVIYHGRLFPAEGIINEEIKAKLMNYLENSFSKGKKVLYYEAIFEDLKDVFANCFNLSDAMMLKQYLRFACDIDEYFFASEYMSKERFVEIDNTAEVEKFMLDVGKPLSYEEVYAGLSHISKDIVYLVIKTDPNIILNEREHYFHLGIFELSPEDADKITDYINNAIDEDGYCIWSIVFEKIKQTMSDFIENNAYLSRLGIRNAVANKLHRRFNFDGEVICHRGDLIAMADVYRLYGEHNAPFSAEDLNCFANEVNGGVIKFDALSKTAVRVNKNLFVSRNDVCFDVEAIDKAIETYFDTGYMLIRDIDSFVLFPNVGYEWNEYLLETYLMYYSKKYELCNNGRSLNNVAGAVVRRGSGYDDFSDVCVDVLAKSECILTKDKALAYLVDVNLLTRKRYKGIDSVLLRAKQKRNGKD